MEWTRVHFYKMQQSVYDEHWLWCFLWWPSRDRYWSSSWSSQWCGSKERRTVPEAWEAEVRLHHTSSVLLYVEITWMFSVKASYIELEKKLKERWLFMWYIMCLRLALNSTEVQEKLHQSLIEATITLEEQKYEQQEQEIRVCIEHLLHSLLSTCILHV